MNENERNDQNLLPIEEPTPAPIIPEAPQENSPAAEEPMVQQTPPVTPETPPASTEILPVEPIVPVPTPPPYSPPPQGAYPPPPPLPQVYYQPPQEKTVPPANGLAIASMVLGIVACAKGNRSGMVIAGLILSGVALLFFFILLALMVLGAGFQVQLFESDFATEFYDGMYV